MHFPVLTMLSEPIKIVGGGKMFLSYREISVQQVNCKVIVLTARKGCVDNILFLKSCCSVSLLRCNKEPTDSTVGKSQDFFSLNFFLFSVF